MKIIQIMPNFGLAGAEIMCENLVYALKERGHNVIVISLFSQRTDITERLEKAGTDVRYLDKKLGLDISMIGKIRRILKKEKPDVIHTHRYVMQYAIPAAIMAGTKKRVHTLHSIASKENGTVARKFNKFFYKFHKVVPVALSSMVQDTVVEEYGLKKESIPVVFNGIRLSNCKVKTDYAVKDIFTILHIGRFQEVKNHFGLVRAFAIFHKRHPDSRLYLIGDGVNKQAVMDYVEQIGLKEAVLFLGQKANVFDDLKGADVFTLPSLYEGVPMTLIEAMGTGLPIVATRVGGVGDMLDDSSALLVPVEEAAITEAFEKYYLDESLRERHGKAALGKAEKFSAEAMARSYEAIYQQ